MLVHDSRVVFVKNFTLCCRNAPKEDGSKRAARLKELAQLHQAKSTNDT